ncbi:MAG TPA: hypothetical protein VFQ51_15055 [Vicinamibacteria bacterium]|nr:hypothetical protein [Vicinamibacteria bacterium]
MPPAAPNRMAPRPMGARPGGFSPRGGPVQTARAQELGVRAAGILFIVSAVMAILRVTVLKTLLPTEATAGQMYGTAFVQVMLGIALLQGSVIARRFVLVVATLGLLALLAAVAFVGEEQDAGPIVWLVAATLIIIPYVALVLLLVGEDHSRLRVGLCIGVLAVYSLGAYAIEIGARRAFERDARQKIAEWAAPESAFAEASLGLSLDPPQGWTRLRADSPPVKDEEGRAGFAHRDTTALAILGLEELRDGPGTPRAHLERVRERHLQREQDVQDLGVTATTVGGVEAQKLTVRWRANEQNVRAWFVFWRDGWRYFTLYGWAPEASADTAAEAFQRLERSVRFTPVLSKDIGDLTRQVADIAPHLSAAAVRALLDRYPNRKLTATEVFRLAHRSSLAGVAGLTPDEVADLSRITAALYAGMSARDRARLGAYQERVRLEKPTTPAEDAEMAQAMRAGTSRLPPESLQRLQELVEKAIAMGTLMDRG